MMWYSILWNTMAKYPMFEVMTSIPYTQLYSCQIPYIYIYKIVYTYIPIGIQLSFLYCNITVNPHEITLYLPLKSSET